jgi:uncharacterized RDD family membrane protein YckC
MSNFRDKAEALFEAAVHLDTETQRTEYLSRACPNPELRREVDSLLEAHLKSKKGAAMETIRIDPGAFQSTVESVESRIGGYRIIRPLGKGGMGEVYEAEEIESGRRVALKVLGHALNSPVARQRFRREGLLAASVNHPNTVYVFGTDEIDGQAVIAMELVRGGTLQDRVSGDAPMPVADAVDSILQVIAGLEAAAALGVLHRDIKPSNCFVETDGTVKVGDFGLSISNSGNDESKLTVTGSFLGTPAFSPPEQLRGDEFTLQGDIYAVGVTLYYLLTGRTPFQADDLVRMLATVLERQPDSPAQWRPDLPDGLCRAILRCLSKQPSKRFKNYAELRNALLPFSSVAPTPATLNLRFLAGCIDWILLAGLTVSATFLSSGQWDALIHPDAYPRTKLFVANFRIIFALAYYAILEGLWGRSVGKWICGLRVIGPNRGFPGVSRALMRATLLVWLPGLPQLTVEWLSYYPELAESAAAKFFQTISAFSGLIWPLLFCTSRRANGFAAIHDLFTRTRVVSPTTHGARPALSVDETQNPPAENTPQVGVYQLRESLQKSESAETLLGFDERLRRKVWIRRISPGSPPVAVSLRNLARPGRLRWLNGRRSPEEAWDAYEAGPGKSLSSVIEKRQPWSRVRFWLFDLAEETAAASKDDTLPGVLDLDRVWITSEGRAKLLDFPAPTGGEQRTPPIRSDSDLPVSPQLFLSQVAVAALEGHPVTAKDARPGSVAVPLPPHARHLLGELQAGLGPGLLAERLKPVLHKFAAVSPKRRLAAIAGCLAFPLLAGALCIALVMGITSYARLHADSIALAQCLNHLNRAQAKPESGNDLTTADPTQQAFEIYIAGRFRQMITNPATWTSLVGATISRDQRTTAEQLIATHPAPSEAEFQKSAEVVQPFLKGQWPHDLENLRGKLAKPKILIPAAAWILVMCSAVPSLIAALLFRGGLVLRALGLTIVRNDGESASRFRIFWRSLVAWSPLLILTLIVSRSIPMLEGLSLEQAILMSNGAILGTGVLLWAALLPERGLHDRVAGTCLIPRE